MVWTLLLAWGKQCDSGGKTAPTPQQVFVMANKGRAEAGKALEAARVAETEAASHRAMAAQKQKQIAELEERAQLFGDPVKQSAQAKVLERKWLRFLLVHAEECSFNAFLLLLAAQRCGAGGGCLKWVLSLLPSCGCAVRKCINGEAHPICTPMYALTEAAGADGGADAARGREQDGIPWRAPRA